MSLLYFLFNALISKSVSKFSISWLLCLSTDRLSVQVMAVYLAEGFPGVPVSSAQAHHHVHSKTPHHVVLQIPVRRGKMFKETLLLTQSYDISVIFTACSALLPQQTHAHKQAITHKHNRLIQTHLLVYLAKIRLSLL